MKSIIVILTILTSISAFALVVKTPRGVFYVETNTSYHCNQNMEKVCDEQGFALHTGQVTCSKSKHVRVQTKYADPIDYGIAVLANLTSSCFYSKKCKAQVEGNEFKNIPALTMVGCE